MMADFQAEFSSFSCSSGAPIHAGVAHPDVVRYISLVKGVSRIQELICLRESGFLTDIVSQFFRNYTECHVSYISRPHVFPDAVAAAEV